MARKPRTEFSGALYHVTARGNNKAMIFRGDHDRALFLDLLGKTIERFGWRLHAYCLMDNHYHLLVETPVANLGRGMQVLGTSYTQAFNRRNHLVGHVFQGRYKAIIVEKESHLLEVMRYIVLNPVAAHAAKSPSDWVWSSFRASAGLSAVPPWLDTGWTLSQFHPTDAKKATGGYKRFVGETPDESPFADLKLGMVLGSEAFVEEMKPLIEESATRDKWAKYPNERRPLCDLFSGLSERKDRNARMLEASALGYSLSEIGGHVGLHEASVSRILCALRRKC